jgi:hypothetical protein
MWAMWLIGSEQVTFLERIDREIIAPLLSGLSKLEKEKDLEFSLVLTGMVKPLAGGGCSTD